MSLRVFDDEKFFIPRRAKLLEPILTSEGHLFRLAASVPRGSAQGASPASDTEKALAKLAPRHGRALRAHMALDQASLESTALVPAHELVQAAVQIEWLWYTSPFKNFYRDHLAHVMKVTAIADDLLTSEDSPLATAGGGHGAAGPLLHRVSQGLAAEGYSPLLHRAALRLGVPRAELRKASFWQGTLREAVKIAGLLHDMAYQGKMSRVLRRSTWAADPLVPPAADFARDVERTLDIIDGTLVGAVFNADSDTPLPRGSLLPVLETILEKSHSLQAGANLLHYGKVADKTWRLEPQEAFAIEWAARAATLHDFDKIWAMRPSRRSKSTSPVSKWLENSSQLAAIRPCFSSDPASYLLAFADQIQDFGRLHYSRCDNSGDETTALRLSYPCIDVKVENMGDGHLRLKWSFGPEEGPFGVPKKKLGEEIRRKREDARKIFGRSKQEGWLDHRGLFETVTVA